MVPVTSKVRRVVITLLKDSDPSYKAVYTLPHNSHSLVVPPQKKRLPRNGNSLQGVVGGLGGKHTLVERHGVFETFFADQQRQVFFPAKMIFFNRKNTWGCWQNPSKMVHGGGYFDLFIFNMKDSMKDTLLTFTES